MIIIFTIAFVLTVALIPVIGFILRKKGILDIPRVQSSHEIPTPRGGGLVVMPVILGIWAWLIAMGYYSWPTEHAAWAMLVSCIMLCLFTWFDDHKPQGLTVRIRLLVQLFAVTIPILAWPLEAGRVLPDVFPILLERALLILAWVWFLNLYNFMDGINGISAVQTISIAGGLLVFTLYSPVQMPMGYESLLVTLIASAAGFLVWNGRVVAKIFLGDVGSVGLGYCLAWVLFVFAAQGHLMPAVVVTLVYALDTSVTLLKRAWQRKKIWQAHREHFYHRATVKGALTHFQCIAWIIVTNLILIGLSFALLYSVVKPFTGFVMGIVIVSCLLRYFFLIGKKNGHKSSPRPKPLRVERMSKLALHKNKKQRQRKKNAKISSTK